jgi:hypothetical protein
MASREALAGLTFPDVLVAVREMFSALSAVQIVGPGNVAQAAVRLKDAVVEQRDPTEASERFVALARKVLHSEQ